jgi:hypothetical protein
MGFTWEYRRIRTGAVVAIYEVHTMDDGSRGWAEEPAAPLGDDADELRRDYDLMRLAFDKPVLAIDGDRLVDAA